MLSCVQIEFPIFKFVPVASYHWEEESGSLFCITAFQVFIHINKFPLSLLFSRLNSPSPLSSSPLNQPCARHAPDTDRSSSRLFKDRGSQTGEKLQIRVCLCCTIVAENGLGLCDAVCNYFNLLLVRHQRDFAIFFTGR